MPDTSHPFILIISTDASFHICLNTLLINQKFNIIHTHSIQQSTKITLNNNDINLVFIDNNLLDHEKINDCINLRKLFPNPIAIVSNTKTNVFNEAELLNYGADAYIDGSRSDVVLLANIQALLRQNDWQRDTNKEATQKERIITIQDLTINLKTYQLYQQNKNIKLTHGEFQLMVILAKQVGKVIKRDDLFIALTGTNYTGQSRALDLRISLLRQKLGDTKTPHRYIKTIRGAGYLLLSDH